MSEYESLRKQIEEYENKIKRNDVLDKVLKREDVNQLPVDLVKKLVTHDEAATNENIELLKKSLGHAEPDLSKTKNPLAKETFNLTEQGKIVQSNPDLAQKLYEQANKY